MNTKIYSKQDPTKLLHMIVREVEDGRTNLCENGQFLQCAALKLPKGTTFKAHRHNWNIVNDIRLAQESWVVISGCVRVFFYDTDGTLLYSGIVNPGEASFTFEGGHNYELLEDCTIFEYKTGPYVGVKHDKTFI